MRRAVRCTLSHLNPPNLKHPTRLSRGSAGPRQRPRIRQQLPAIAVPAQSHLRPAELAASTCWPVFDVGHGRRTAIRCTTRGCCIEKLGAFPWEPISNGNAKCLPIRSTSRRRASLGEDPDRYALGSRTILSSTRTNTSSLFHAIDRERRTSASRAGRRVDPLRSRLVGSSPPSAAPPRT